MSKWIFCVVALFGGWCSAQEWNRGVDQDTSGSYAENSIIWHGVNSPAVTVRPAKDQWPHLQLAGLQTYIYVFYGKERDLDCKRFGSFGRIVPEIGAKPEQLVPGKPTWNGKSYTWRWGDGGQRQMLLHFSNLMPGVRVETESNQLILFNESGKEPPSLLVMPTAQGVESQRLSTVAAAGAADFARVDCMAMSEAWLLVGFADSAGMKDVQYGGEISRDVYHGADCPWLIILQHKPRSLTTGPAGLAFQFDGPAGSIAIMPLYGRLIQRPEATRAWIEKVPDEVVQQSRFWTRVARMPPVSCREEFQYDLDQGKLIIRNTFDYQAIEDDWKTPPLRVAPIPPAVAIARMYSRAHEFPLEFQQELNDTGMRSQWGPYVCAMDSDHVSYSVGNLARYIDQTLQIAPGAGATWDDVIGRLQHQVAAFIAQKSTLNRATWSPNENGAIYIGTKPEQVWALARSLPHLAPELRQKSQQFAADLIRQDLLNIANWRQSGAAYSQPAMSYQGARSQLKVWMEGQSARVLYAMWAYAQHTGDWDVVRQNWNLMRQAFGSLLQGQDYASCMAGQPHVPWRLNSSINGLIGFARMARQVGDRESENRAAYLLGKSMVAWLAQWRAPSYLQHCEPNEERWHALRIYGNVYGDLLPKLQSASGTYLDTRTQSWWPDQGFSWCTDPTLFSAPWSEIFLEASPELLRFYDDYFHQDVSDQFDFVRWIWPAMFSNAFSYQMGLGQWGFASPYLRVAAVIKKEKPQQLLKWLPDAQMPEDPFYLENLLAILYADGHPQWVPLRPAVNPRP